MQHLVKVLGSAPASLKSEGSAVSDNFFRVLRAVWDFSGVHDGGAVIIILMSKKLYTSSPGYCNKFVILNVPKTFSLLNFRKCSILGVGILAPDSTERKGPPPRLVPSSVDFNANKSTIF